MKRHCPDPLCVPKKKLRKRTCMAVETNEGAVDAEQFVWIRIWDECPFLKEED